MTIQEAYLRFIMHVNKNATNNNINVDKARFVLAFNEEQNFYVKRQLNKRNDDSIRNIQVLLHVDTPLTPTTKTEELSRYALPKDYFDFANIRAIAKTDCCEGELLVYEIKSEDKEERDNDVNNEPSFEWRETFCYIANNNIVIFKKDFELSKVFLTYYVYPPKVEMEGYKKPDGTRTNVDIDPIFDDKVVEDIIIRMATVFAGINGDQQRYMINKDKLFDA